MTDRERLRAQFMQEMAAKDQAAAAEQAAIQAAKDARAARDRSEKVARDLHERVIKADRLVEESAQQQLTAIEKRLADAREMEQRAAPLLDLTVRGLARQFLYGAGEQHLIALASSDAVAGQFYEVSRAAGSVILRVQQEALGVELLRRADQLECAGWAGFTRRIRALAGEEVQQ